jgi:hypothetical protein
MGVISNIKRFKTGFAMTSIHKKISSLQEESRDLFYKRLTEEALLLKGSCLIQEDEDNHITTYYKILDVVKVKPSGVLYLTMFKLVSFNHGQHSQYMSTVSANAVDTLQNPDIEDLSTKEFEEIQSKAIIYYKDCIETLNLI